jgi:DNA modification methylase
VILRGDCLELLKTIPDASVDMVLCDPPYGTTACKWDSVIPFKLMWKELKRVTKANGAIVIFGSEPFSSHLRVSNVRDFKYDWIWDKIRPVGFLNAKRAPMKRHEIASVFQTKKYNPQMVPLERPQTYKCYGPSETNSEMKNDGVRRVRTHKYPQSIVEFSAGPTKGRVHPTQKPVALLEYLIKTYTVENETVLDFTMGSGSTGVACANTNRQFIGIELDEKYFAIAEKRINEALAAKQSGAA